MVIEIKHYQYKEYLNKIRSYLKDIINNLKKSDSWKIPLTIAINFISSKDYDEERVMNSKSNSIEIMINDIRDEVINELLNHSKIDAKIIMKSQSKLVSLSSILFIYYIINVMK